MFFELCVSKSTHGGAVCGRMYRNVRTGVMRVQGMMLHSDMSHVDVSWHVSSNSSITFGKRVVDHKETKQCNEVTIRNIIPKQ